MRSVLLILIIIVSLASTACSYVTDFVVINASDAPIEIGIRLKVPTVGRAEIDYTPAVITKSQLKTREKNNWTKLSVDRYEINQVTRTVNVKLLPQEALFIASMFHYFGPDDPNDVRSFPIAELGVIGSTGSMKYSGIQLLKAFSEQSKILYTLTYQ